MQDIFCRAEVCREEEGVTSRLANLLTFSITAQKLLEAHLPALAPRTINPAQGFPALRLIFSHRPFF